MIAVVSLTCPNNELKRITFPNGTFMRVCSRTTARGNETIIMKEIADGITTGITREILQIFNSNWKPYRNENKFC